MARTYADVARRLYLTEERTSAFLTQLLALGVVQRSDEQASSYYYRPATPDLALLLDRLDVVYSKHLVAVTKLVHAARDQSAEQFAKAFQFRRES
jgi:hypothetical protein